MKRPKIIDLDDLPQAATTALRDTLVEWARDAASHDDGDETGKCPACAFLALDDKMKMGEEPPTGWTWFRGVHGV